MPAAIAQPDRHTPRFEDRVMQRRLLKSALCAACALLPLSIVTAAPADAQTVVEPQQDLVLSIGRGQLINVPGQMTDVFVANEAIADVEVKSRRQLYVMGRAGGETTVYASNAAGDIVWSANVRVGSNLDSVDQMLGLAMPEAKIAVATMGSNMVLLTGTVASPEEAAEAQRLVEAFVGEGSKVIARLRMATPLQVNLRVRFAEVNRSLMRVIGTNLTTIDGTSGFQFGIGQNPGFATSFRPGSATGTGTDVSVYVPDPNNPGQFIEEDGTSINPAALGTTLAGVGRFLGLDVAGALDLGEREGLVTTLSEPNLTALSGETAEFLAGGEFPIPLSQGLGAVSVEYKKYGVSLSYTPTVLTSGRISIRVRPEVSELSAAGAVTIGGTQVPGLTTRRAETTVELGSGQSFMIAGLMSNNAQNLVDRAPGLADLPILGNMFRSTDFRKGQTELVIIVTPYLVKPVDDSEIKLPTDGFHTPTPGGQLLEYRQTSDGAAERPMPRAAGEAPTTEEQATTQQNQEQGAVAAEPGFTLY
jgi:pilus assembly protein CpaC